MKKYSKKYLNFHVTKKQIYVKYDNARLGRIFKNWPFKVLKFFSL